MIKQSLAERDRQVVWHPFTQMKTSGESIAISKGKAAKIWDDQGNCYIDAIASWWMNLHGHAHPYIAEALYKQALELEHVIFANFTHEPAVRLAERILEKLPSNQAKVFFSDNGSTSVEVAIKMCFQYWYNLGKPRTKIIAFEEAYHGDTFGAMSVGGRSSFSAPFAPFLFDVLFIEAPLPGREKEAIQQLELLLKEYPQQIAGFIFEPLVQGSAGMRMYEPEPLEEMLGLCKADGVLCIADEVMTGFGRTGKFWATDALNIQPDIFCLSKGLTGGTMALGLTTCKAEIFEAFWSDDKLKTFFHGHSCTGNPLACAVALASLDLMEKEETWQNIHRIEESHQAFSQKLKSFSIAHNIRQRGVILAFDIVLTEDTETSYFNGLRDHIWNFFIQRQVLLRPLGNTVYILAPYCIEEEELETVYDTIIELLQSLASK